MTFTARVRRASRTGNDKLFNFNKIQAFWSMNTEFARQKMVEQQVRVWDVSDASVLAVLGAVAREKFVPQGFANVAYADTEIPLGHGHVMLRPIIEGRLLQALALMPADEVLEVGTGSGYLTACIAAMSASVTSIDVHDDFVALARQQLEESGVDNATVSVMDAMQELPDGEFDAIAVTGAMAALDERFTGMLKPGGRLFIVIGESPAMAALLITRAADGSLQHHSLFETDIPALENVPAANRFSF